MIIDSYVLYHTVHTVSVYVWATNTYIYTYTVYACDKYTVHSYSAVHIC